MSKFDLGDYVDVEARMKWFFENYPTGSLQSTIVVGPESDKPFVVVEAFAYRGPEDQRPGIGVAYEVFPGTTPYTKGSELMNAETSAWGRALAAIGAPTKGHVASRDEVEGAQSRREAKAPKQRGQGTKSSTPPPAEPPPITEADGQSVIPTEHEHTWVPSPTMAGWVMCSDKMCGKVVRKESVDA